MEPTKVLECLADCCSAIKDELEYSVLPYNRDMDLFPDEIKDKVTFKIAEMISKELGYSVDFCLDVLYNSDIDIEAFYK